MLREEFRRHLEGYLGSLRSRAVQTFLRRPGTMIDRGWRPVLDTEPHLCVYELGLPTNRGQRLVRDRNRGVVILFSFSRSRSPHKLECKIPDQAGSASKLST
ncbi:MAG: hypothetical protein AB1758_32060 [Candidatus Eremiobacterota bacterium]